MRAGISAPRITTAQSPAAVRGTRASAILYPNVGENTPLVTTPSPDVVSTR